MTAVQPEAYEALQRRLRSVRRPRPLLSRSRERALTARQRELLDQLEHIFYAEGFADLTMAGLASRLSCSLRTLYALAPSRDELVLMVVDRHLWRVGHTARAAIGPEMSPLESLRTYLRSATEAVSERTEPFARDLSAVPAAQVLADGHRRYLYDVAVALLDIARQRGQIRNVDTAAVAHVLAGLGGLFSEPDVIPTLRSSPKEAADELVGLILRCLERNADAGAGTTHR